MRTLLVALIAMLTTMGCGSSDAEESKGTPPTIKDVTLDKTEVTKGSVETVKVTVAYSDLEGDVAKVVEQLLPKEGTSTAPNELSLDKAAGQKEGTHALALQIAALKAGEVDVAFWLVDAKGNESEHVKRTITVK
jgi:hypothetical protein